MAEHPTTQLKVLWAAEDIEHLRAENERLRAALTEIARLAVNDSPWFAEIARAALKESK